MNRVCENKYIENVNGRIYYSGEMLPDDYNPPIDYFSNKIVEKVQVNEKKNIIDDRKEKIKEYKGELK
jgi:hypothetical protein